MTAAMSRRVHSRRVRKRIAERDGMYSFARLWTSLVTGVAFQMGALRFRDGLSEEARWWVNFCLIILAVLLAVGLLVLGWHS